MFANPRFKGCICALSNPPTPLREIKKEKGGKMVKTNIKIVMMIIIITIIITIIIFFLNYLKYFIKLFSN